MNIMTYKGFSIAESDGHGKTVKGNKKTTTIQVRDHRHCQRGFFLSKQISYPINDIKKRTEAISKAKDHIDNLLAIAN